MISRDYYEVLGVGRDASVDEIKRAYRKQALDNHPDRNPDNAQAEEQFKAATEAYDVLSDADKRARYDRFGHAGVRSAAGGSVDFDLADALRTFMRDFGGGLGGFDFFGGGRREDDRRGGGLQVRLALDLDEVAKGAKKQIKLRKLMTCKVCEGSGAREGSRPKTCDSCGGRGEVRQVSRSFFGQFMNVSVCPACEGTGQTISDPCPECRGEGRKPGEATISVDVPAGIAEGNYIQLRGLGEAGRRGGEPGDVIAVIEEKEHELFVRRGKDLLMELSVTYTKAVLGGEEEIPTLDGKLSIDIPRGIQSGKVLRLRGKGIPALRDARCGDILVRVRVWVPERPGSDERSLLEDLRRVESKPPSPGERRQSGWFDRVRDAWGG
jgi:molecular chaperone DnaJ